MNCLSPIVLFVYNRPGHTRLVIKALSENELARESDLYIFSDGVKGLSDKSSVSAVRKYIKSIRGFRNITIVENEENMGLSRSIISGVTEIINRREKVIVLEDDILPSKGFLRYMNEALNLYDNDIKVGCIHAWNYNLDCRNYKETTYFLKGADCWGWGTWKRAWDIFNDNGNELLEIIKTNNLEFEFNRRNTHSYVSMLEDQIAGKNDSWAIRWHASLFINGIFCLHPVQTIVKNIGLDNSGVHSGNMTICQNPVRSVNISRIPVCESEWFYLAYRDYLNGERKTLIWILQKVKQVFKSIKF